MCGLCGYVGLHEEGLLETMTSSLAHRGPDDVGYLRGPGWGLGHRRLSIIDLAGGHQPIANEDESAFVMVNGEITMSGTGQDLLARPEVRAAYLDGGRH